MSAAFLVEKLGSSSVPSDLHQPQLRPVPRVKVGGTNKSDVYAHITVNGGAVEANVDGVGG